jgi:hypothetical protein
MILTNANSMNIIYIWNKFLSLFFTNNVSIILSISIKSLFESRKVLISFIKSYLTYRKKNTKHKIYIIVLSSIEKMYSILKYKKFNKTTQKLFFQNILFSFESKNNSQSLLFTFNSPKFLFLTKKLIENKKTKIKFLVQDLAPISYSLYKTHKILTTGNYFIIFEQYYFIKNLQNNLRLENYFYFIRDHVFKKNRIIYLMFKKSENFNNISKLFCTFKIPKKKIIILVSYKSNFKKFINFLNIMQINVIYLSAFFPKDLIFSKIKMFNSKSEGVLVLKNKISFVNKVLKNIDPREVFLMIYSKKNSLKCMCIYYSDYLSKKCISCNKPEIYLANFKQFR